MSTWHHHFTLLPCKPNRANQIVNYLYLDLDYTWLEPIRDYSVAQKSDMRARLTSATVYLAGTLSRDHNDINELTCSDSCTHVGPPLSECRPFKHSSYTVNLATIWNQGCLRCCVIGSANASPNGCYDIECHNKGNDIVMGHLWSTQME